MLEHGELVLEVVERLDARARALTGEDALLDALELQLQRLKHGEIAVDDGVEQRIEHVAGPVPQQVRLTLAAFPHVGEASLRPPPHRHHVLRSDEHVDLADDQLAIDHLHRLHDVEQAFAVLLQLGALLALARILHRELVQAEGLLQDQQLRLAGVLQRHPDEAVRQRGVPADVAEVDVRDLAAPLVHGTVDQHGCPVRSGSGL